MGKRGTHHADAFQKNGRFQLVGLCDIDAGRLEAAAKEVRRQRNQCGCRGAGQENAARHLLLLHAARPAPAADSRRRGGRREADCLRKTHGAFHQRSAGDDEACARGGSEDRGQPPAPLRRALQEGEGDHRQRRHRPRAHRLRPRHRLDDAHDDAPHRLRPLVQRLRGGGVGGGPGARQGEVCG